MAVGKPGTATNYIQQAIGNPIVSWERSRKTNLGLEAKFFKNKISFMQIEGYLPPD